MEICTHLKILIQYNSEPFLLEILAEQIREMMIENYVQNYLSLPLQF